MQMLVYLSVCIFIALYSPFPLGVWVSITMVSLIHNLNPAVGTFQFKGSTVLSCLGISTYVAAIVCRYVVSSSLDSPQAVFLLFFCVLCHGMTCAYTANGNPLGGKLYMQMLVNLSVYHLCTMLTLHFPLTYLHYLLTFSVLSHGKDSTGSQSSERPVQSGTPGKGVVGGIVSVYCVDNCIY